MSTKSVRNRIIILQKKLDNDSYGTNISHPVIVGVNNLLDAYGNFIGMAKAKHRDYLEELKELDKQVESIFVAFAKSGNRAHGHKILALGIQKISELLSFVEGLESAPKEEVPKKLYEKMIEENKANKRVIEILSKVRGIPELNELLEKACSVGIRIDESWILAICSINLIEAGVNKKLEELEVSAEGSFEKKYRRLVSQVETKEHRTIQHLLPMALYKGIRNKLDHASHANRVTSEEANKIFKMVIDILDELFR